MSAWDKLLAASSLAIGTAWQLISSPRSGVGGTVVVDRVTMTCESPTNMTVNDAPCVVVFQDQPSVIAIKDSTITIVAKDNQTTFEVQP